MPATVQPATDANTKRACSPSTTGNNDDTSCKRMKLDHPTDYPKLDASDKVQAHRIQQRRKMIAKGKNTVGYDEYIKRVPKHKRRPRSMKHPVTPDHRLDIPGKRWQGLVKAWRKALHQYDPPDLMKSFDAVAATPESTSEPTTSVQGAEIAKAAEKGMLVDTASPEEEEHSPTTVMASSSMTLLDKWDQDREKANGDDDDDFLDVDSDDDLL